MNILVVDDHPLYRDGLVLLLQQIYPEAMVLQAPDCETAFALLRSGRICDLVLMDLNMRGTDGREAIRALHGGYPELPVLVVTASDDVADVASSLAAGAAGVVHKSAGRETLAAALRIVRGGGRYVPPETMFRINGPAHPGESSFSQTASADACPDASNLTPRELEVLGQVCAGLPNKVIGARLGISEATVRAHLTSIFRALCVINRTQAARVARERNLLPPS